MPITYPPQAAAPNVATVDGSGYVYGDPDAPGIKVVKTNDAGVISRAIWMKDAEEEIEIVSSGG